jgi:hypothetical protein
MRTSQIWVATGSLDYRKDAGGTWKNRPISRRLNMTMGHEYGEKRISTSIQTHQEVAS